jgi:hypothetical protein
VAPALRASRPRLIRATYVVAVGVAMIGWVWMLFGGLEWVLGA